MAGLIVLALLLVVFWMVLVRPQRSRTREQQELIASLEPGDEIVTAGGLYGVIERIEGDVLHLKVADGVVLRTARRAVAGFVEHDEEAETRPGETPQSGYSEDSS
jgi:preprotein translocase subunit YajC